MATYNELLAKAEAGDSEAQYMLAMAIFTGKPEGDRLYPGSCVFLFNESVWMKL